MSSSSHHANESRLYTFYQALCHDNLSLIEIFIEQGFTFHQNIHNNQCALTIALDKESINSLEYLLIISMRESEYFSVDILKQTLAWSLLRQYDKLIELSLYALKQHRVKDRSLLAFMAACDYMSSVQDILKDSQSIPVNHMTRLKSLLFADTLTKEQIRHLYHIWRSHFSPNHKQSLEIYQIIAESYYQCDRSIRSKKLKFYSLKAYFLSPLLVILAIGYLVLAHNVYENIFVIHNSELFKYSHLYSKYALFSIILFITLCLISLVFIYLAKSFFMKSFRCLKDLTKEQLDRDLLLSVRYGKLEETIFLIQVKCARVNSISGVAKSTPLFEARRFGQEKIAQFLLTYDAYSMQGDKVF